MAISTAMVYIAVAPARRIWRGEASAVPRLPPLSLSARNYVAFLVWFVPVFVGILVMGGAVAASTLVDDEAALAPVGRVAIGLLGGGVALVPLYLCVSAFAQPKFMIPPPYRGQAGSVADARRRWRRRRAGLPPTDHVVEIRDVRPKSPGHFEPYLMAACTDPECDWQQYSDPKLIGISEEQHLRDKAARHTTAVATGVRMRLR
jgi:hypothetical protein